jgi:hypothetical protein
VMVHCMVVKTRVANSPSVLVGVLPTDGLALKAIPD